VKTEILRKILQERLSRIRIGLWERSFRHRPSEPEYHHQIAVEKKWARYLSSIGCRQMADHEIRRDFESAFNELAPDMVCVKIEGSGFVFIPRELAMKMMVLEGMP
jgi:hypothetical protein